MTLAAVKLASGQILRVNRISHREETEGQTHTQTHTQTHRQTDLLFIYILAGVPVLRTGSVCPVPLEKVPLLRTGSVPSH